MTKISVLNDNKLLMKNTFCIFQEVEISSIENRQYDYKSKSGSEYFFETDGVYRFSDHWGRTAKSKWRLIPIDDQKRKSKVGYAKCTDFHKDNDLEKLYFIEFNKLRNEVFFNHKNNCKSIEKVFLRTTSDTTKVIRQVRKLLESDSWTNYYCQKNIKEIVVLELINSTKTLAEIKKSYLPVSKKLN
jgi:hypothetical protein